MVSIHLLFSFLPTEFFKFFVSGLMLSMCFDFLCTLLCLVFVFYENIIVLRALLCVYYSANHVREFSFMP